MSKQNPYESPQNPNPTGSPGKRPPSWTAAAVLLGLLSIPAAVIAFFTTCTATLATNQSDFAAFVLGAIAGVVVFGGMIYFMARLVWR